MTPSRFLVLAKPQAPVLQAFVDAFDATQLRSQARGALFDPANWHQSLTAPSFERSAVEPLRRACARIRAPACTVALNRIRGSESFSGIHWAFHAYGMPACFQRLLAEFKSAQEAENLEVLHGHRPHLTISYKAPFAFDSIAIGPILWTIDEILLVEGHVVDGHFVYDVIDHWSLPPVQQPSLFD